MIVSVITSVYNCENYIEEMMDSVLKQSMKDWELIIIDDASTDNTWNLIVKYNDSRIIKLRNNKNRGLTYNLNQALSLAKGKYIVRIDGDDVAHPERFEKQVQYMEENPEVVLSGCWMKTIGGLKSIYQGILNENAVKINLLFNAAIFHPTFIIRKYILDKYNIKYNEQLRYAQDYNLEFILSKYGKINNISEILMYYRVHYSQVSIDKQKEQEECANQTRKAILKDLDIFFDDVEFICWNKFCLFSCYPLKQEEINILQKICDEIIQKNEVKKIYSPILLRNILFARLINYLNGCRKKINKVEDKNNITDKYHSLFMVMCQWIKLKQSGKSLVTYFQRKGIHSIAIYGMGEVGKLLFTELIESGVEVKYGIDKNKEIFYFENRVKIFNPEESNLEKVDAIIVTAILYITEIKTKLNAVFDCPIISLADIIYELI